MDVKNKELIEKARYIENMFLAHSQKLRNVLLKFNAVDSGMVNDVVNAAFMKLYDKYDEIDQSVPVWPFLYKIAIGVAQNEKRKNRTRDFVSFSGDIEIAGEDQTDQMDQVIKDLSFSQGLEEVRKKLTDKEWIVFVDNYINELSHREISQRDGISEANSRNKKKRLAKKLRAFDWKDFFGR